jgi:hypothetical protein
MLHHAPGGNGIDKLVDDLFQSDKLGFEAVPELIQAGGGKGKRIHSVGKYGMQT